MSKLPNNLANVGNLLKLKSNNESQENKITFTEDIKSPAHSPRVNMSATEIDPKLDLYIRAMIAPSLEKIDKMYKMVTDMYGNSMAKRKKTPPVTTGFLEQQDPIKGDADNMIDQKAKAPRTTALSINRYFAAHFDRYAGDVVAIPELNDILTSKAVNARGIETSKGGRITEIWSVLSKGTAKALVDLKEKIARDKKADIPATKSTAPLNPIT